MIIFINGAFGVGKTTVADIISKRLNGSHIYDPELLGAFLRGVLPKSMDKTDDFQDIPLWRQLNLQILEQITHHGVIIVPMTIFVRQYYDEIIGRLVSEGADARHFILTADRQTVIDRLNKRGEKADCWGARLVDACLKAFENDIPGEKVNTVGRSAQAVADDILSRLGLSDEN